LAGRWGNQANAFRIVSQDEDRIVIEGAFLDYETNSRTLRSVTVPRFYISRDTKARIPLDDKRMNEAILSGGSKAVRNAILNGLPVWLVEAYYRKSRELAAKQIGGKAESKKPKSFEERLAWLVKAFEKAGVKAETLRDYIANRVDKNLEDEEKLSYLIGLYNAIKDGQTTIEDVFGQGDKKEGQEQAQVTLEQVMGKQQ